jgi:hypothetical protein
VPGWACEVDLRMVSGSAEMLRALVDKRGWSKVMIPQFSFNAYKWSQIRGRLGMELDSRFVLVESRKLKPPPKRDYF